MTAWNDEHHDLLDDLIGRLEQAWQAGGTVALGQFVPPTGHPARGPALLALIQADQELRWQHGLSTTVEEYLTDWPELRTQPECVAELRESEQRLRMESRMGRYELRAELGRGGMGTVYRAFDTQLEREVALKIPSCDPRREPAVVERFLQEGKAAARIQHPHVCPIYDAGCVNGTYYLVMALIDGESLTQRMQAHLPAPGEAAELIRKLAGALQVVHDQGIVHRDIKPANVMVNRQGEPLLMDFGLARRVDGAGGQTATGALVGTIPYMSPEQVNGQPADRRSDVYSLGVVFYQLLAGQLPFQGKLTDLLLRIGHAEPAKPSSLRPGLDPQLEAVCLKAMAKKPEARYRSAAELAAALQACPPPNSAPRARSRRRAVVVAVGVLATLAAVAVLCAVLYRSGNGRVVVGDSLGDPSVAAPTSDDRSPHELKFEFFLQPRDESRPLQPLSASHFPLRDGDLIQLHASLAREAYVYVYWFDHRGQPQRLYPPPEVPSVEHRKTREVWVPPNAEPRANADGKPRCQPLQDMRGVETVFVGVADQPRLEEDLRQLETLYQVPARLVPGPGLTAFSYPVVAVRQVRGVDSKVVPAKDWGNPVETFEPVLRQHFAEYSGWVLVNE